ncbi:MAG TPA: histidine phosphatase family protein [Acetobacteraceae bacterium]|nr:histidine phosphatase family protein [Acetobacteraceae bacterium]
MSGAERQILLIIRHAEKPPEAPAQPPPFGINQDGIQDPKSLTARGWERAGMWAELFAPSLGGTGPLPRPDAIFASAPAAHHDDVGLDGGSKSRRPLETVSALARKLGLTIDLSFVRGQEAGLGAALSARPGVTLVCWQHELIANIAKALTPPPQGVPTKWPGSRFNVVYRFVRTAGPGSAWRFDQIVPVMLDGDSDQTIPVS